MKAAPSSIRIVLAMQDVHRIMAGGTPRRSQVEDQIVRVVAVFERLQVAWCLIGAQALGIYLEPRATQDFDFVIDDRRLRPLLEGLRDELGTIDAEELGPAVRLRALHVDLVRSSNHALFREALARRTEVQGWQLPPPELMVVLKLLSSTSPWRGRDKRRRDTLDLVELYEGLQPDRATMLELARLVYPGARDELEELLDSVDRGDPISI